jgi:hypothetical protein
VKNLPIGKFKDKVIKNAINGVSRMTKQYCVRTYEENYSDFQNNPCAKVNCEVLNSYLKKGWKVVRVTPKPKYNEYIIEKEINDKKGVE